MIMTNILKKLIRTYGIENLIVVWDGGRSGRDVIDSQYKAGRIPAGKLWQDIVFMARLIEHLGITSAMAPGYEADDAIASLATQIDEPIRIYSNDRDFYQLVNDRIMVLKPGKGKEENLSIDTKVVEEITGYPPEKLVLVKSFKGDVSDNIQKLPIRFTGKFKTGFNQTVLVSKDVEHFYQQMDPFFEDNAKTALLAFKDRAIINQSLLKMMRDLEVAVEQTPADLAKANALVAECSTYKIDLDFFRQT